MSSSIEFFDISVGGDIRFDVYPERLRDRIQVRHEKLIHKMIAKFKKGEPLTPHFEFSIRKNFFSYPQDAETDFKVKRPVRYPAVSLANEAVLQEFLNRVPPRSKITELKRADGQEPSTNPAFAQLHSVRNGEMGWGIDRFGCLSLQLTYIQGGRLRHELVFVERTTVTPPTVDAPSINAPMVSPPTADPPTANASSSNTKAVDSTVINIEDDDDDCYIVEGPNVTKGSKLKNATAVKEETTADENKATTDEKKATTDENKATMDEKKATMDEKKATTDERKPMAYQAPTVIDFTDEDDENSCVIDNPNAAR